MVQCPELCGRMASSLTRNRGDRPGPPGTSNPSTAITPVTPSAPARRTAADAATPASSSSSPGAGATTSRQTPATCSVCTTGHTATWPVGLRASRTASSRLNGTRSSTSSGSPAAWVNHCAAVPAPASAGSATTRTPLPS